MNADHPLSRYSRLCAWGAILLGSIGLIIWVLQAGRVDTAGAFNILMSPNTALFLGISGLSLLWQQELPTDRLARAGQVLGLLIFVGACAILLEYNLGIRTGIRSILFRDSPDTLLSTYRVPMNTVVPFCLTGLALLFLGRTRRSWFTVNSWLGWVILSFSLLNWVSSTLGVYVPGRLSILGALGLILLGSGLITNRLDVSLRGLLQGTHALGLPSLWLALVGMIVPLGLYAVAIRLLEPVAPQLHDMLLLVAILYSVILHGTFTLSLRQMDTLDRRRRQAEGSRDDLMARLQQQAASLEIQVAERTHRLHETSERLQLALSSSNFGVWDWDVASQRLLWDKRQLEIYGMKAEDFNGERQRWLELIHPQDRERMREMENQVLESANVYSYSFRIIRPDGAVRQIEAHGYVQRDSRNRAQRVIGINRDVTTEREHAQAVDALNQRLQFVLNATGYGVWEYDLDHKQIIRDDHMLMFYGRKRTEVTGDIAEWQKLVHPEDLPEIEHQLRELIAGNIERFHQQYRILRPDGTVRWLESQGYALRDADGRAQRLIGMACDVTATRELREELRITEERWRLAISSNNDGVWDWDIATGEVFRDARCLEIVGYQPGELPSDRHIWQSIGHPEDSPATNKALADYLVGRVPLYQSEYRVRHKLGHWVWMMSRGKIVARDALGQPLRMVGTKTDVTSRKELEERLRHGEELSLQLGRLAQIGAWEWNLLTGLLTWSPEMFRVHEVELGFNPNPEKALEFFRGEARRTMSDALQHAIRTGAGFDLELPFTTSRGKQRWVRVLGRSEVHEGSTTRVYGAFQDITDRRDAEDTRRHLEGQLFQAQKMETLGTLAGGIAHDFNNLLTGILGYQDLALDILPEGDSARNYLAASREASMRARELVDQILTFSRQAGSEKVPVNLAQLMDDARRFLRATVPSTIRIEAEVEQGCPRVLADATQIHQVLLNLGSNAAHAMRSTGGTMRLTLKLVDLTSEDAAALSHLPPGRYLRLDFGDTGHGMDEDVRKRIFDPFFTTKEVGQGTGLGLSVVHGIIQAHRGAITVASAPGAGTTFTLHLPVAPESPGEVETDSSAVPRGSGELIAVVDDEDIVRSFAQMALEKLGYRVASYDSPTQCLEVLRRSQNDYALLLTDQTMPVMKGIELAAEARAIAPNLPVIIMSGYFSRISPDKLAQIGQVALLSKPFTNEELARCIHRGLHPESAAME